MDSEHDDRLMMNEHLLHDFKDEGLYELANDIGYFQTNPLPSAERVQERAGTADGMRSRTTWSSDSRPASGFMSPDNSTAAMSDETPSKKKKRATRAGVVDKSSKGLRHFSLKVCEKVKERHRTTYNEVAEDLVLEFGQLAASEDSKVEFDEKNIRRRVYDALNVLMALDIIVKEKKEIIWRGWSDSSPKADLQAYREQVAARKELTEQKEKYFAELSAQYEAMNNLVKRNMQGNMEGHRIELPFILVKTSSEALVDVNMSVDSDVCHIDFHKHKFELHDDNYVLGQLGLDKLNVEEPTASGASSQLGSSADAHCQHTLLAHDKGKQHMQWSAKTMTGTLAGS
mmetsp:Transcript_48389/g.92571  ORF Transcript_48389/g.92571 Transcript_48389/m.92571 type:complete len:343 (+) Transcript_48389:387-1415(+)|eukprot:CAMPEP_0114248956 /NCGR_PEP_ID=MMETSP0058-20121206/13861_1 /TAXON_ID=36894 /ORGANISM="Pyramimonas parkeae, CCMP726" /LENGTH=342 /DNA_ID=CAMNT_0001362421 /DNA_START=311 /DNA_END=1339 /DNA_ORIENTATION=+